MKYKALIAAIFATSILSSCALVYRPSIQQGNIITDSGISKIRVGMSRKQVEDTLGSPVDVQVFRNNKITYVYFLRPHRGPIKRRHFIVTFRSGRVSSWTTG